MDRNFTRYTERKFISGVRQYITKKLHYICTYLQLFERKKFPSFCQSLFYTSVHLSMIVNKFTNGAGVFIIVH